MMEVRIMTEDAVRKQLATCDHGLAVAREILDIQLDALALAQSELREMHRPSYRLVQTEFRRILRVRSARAKRRITFLLDSIDNLHEEIVEQEEERNLYATALQNYLQVEEERQPKKKKT